MIYRVQSMIFLVFYTISMVALSIPLIRLVISLSPNHLYPLVVTALLYMVLVVVLGSLIHTLSYIPSKLASAFDPIKNDIASGKIRDLKKLGEKVAEFVVKFFNFAFLDIDHAFLHTEKTGVVSNEDLPEAVAAMEEFGMLEKSKSHIKIIRAGKISHNNNLYHLYILPIWLGDQWLGYMGLMSKHRIGRFHQRFLTEFENIFLDDQFMHVSRISN